MEEVNRRSASLLIKVIGISYLAGFSGADAEVVPAMLELGVVGDDESGQSSVLRRGGNEGATVSALVLQNPFLPIDHIFEITVPKHDAAIYVRLSAPPGTVMSGDGDGSDGIVEGEAQFAFSDVLRTRTLSIELLLQSCRGRGETVAVKMVCSARGQYTVDEWGLLEWLGDGAADLPMLLRCGVRSLKDLEALSLSELLCAMEEAGVAPAIRARLAGRFHASKAAGPGFLGAYGKALGARILRFYTRPGALSAPPGLGGGGGCAWRGSLEPRWAGHLFEECMVNHSPWKVEQQEGLLSVADRKESRIIPEQ